MGWISVARVGLYPALMALAFCGQALALPNIVYILADDMGQGDVAGYNPDLALPSPHTPHEPSAAYVGKSEACTRGD